MVVCVCARDYAARQRVDFDLSCHCQMIHLRPRHRRRRKRKTRTLIRHNKVNEKSSTIPSFLVGMWSIFALLARLQSHRQCVRARKHYAQFMTPPLEKKSGGLQQSCFFTVQVAFLFGNLINCLRDRKRPKLTTRVTGGWWCIGAKKEMPSLVHIVCYAHKTRW